jgi:hypothetical protein
MISFRFKMMGPADFSSVFKSISELFCKFFTSSLFGAPLDFSLDLAGSASVSSI